LHSFSTVFEKEILKKSKINLGDKIKALNFALPIKNGGQNKDQKDL